MNAMTDPTMTTPDLNVPNFLGGCIMENCLALMLYGVTITQTYVYLLNCRRDKGFIKTLVFTVWILETLHTAFLLRQIYYLAITGFGHVDVLGRIDWSIGASLLVESCLIWLVQAFYIRRIWILNGKQILPVIFLSLVLVVCVAFHITASAYTFVAGTWLDYFNISGATVSVESANALSATLDGLIAASMIYLLWRSKTGFQWTDGILRWLMVYVVNTGAVTMVWSIAIAITYSVEHESLVVNGMTTVVSKLYANSFLGYLNARWMIRDKQRKSSVLSVLNTDEFELPISRSRSIGHSGNNAQRVNLGQALPLSIDKETPHIVSMNCEDMSSGTGEPAKVTPM